jgi:enoyl-CoA hydratase/carnithine racemase
VDTIITERHDEILLIRLNRPRQRNALSTKLLEELASAIDIAENDSAVRAVVLTGNEQAFSAGQDLKEVEPPHYIELINSTFSRLETMSKPTLAAIDGWCIAGGFELALCCDIRVCGTGAKIGDWHARINSIGGAGATVRLVRTIGLARAKELVFSGAALESQAALTAGLVSHVVPSAELLGSVIALAKSFSVGSAITVGYAKKSLNAAADMNLADALAFSLQCQRAVRDAQSKSYGEQFATRDPKGSQS